MTDNTCLYINCKTEAEIFLFIVFVLNGLVVWFFINLPIWIRLHECKKGNHRKIITKHYGYEIISCQCGKYEYLHDYEDDITVRITK